LKIRSGRSAWAKAGASDGKAIGGCPALHFEDAAPTAAHLAALAAKPNL
jgi:hypothetical protein